MSESKSGWIRDLFLIPLIVGVVVAAFTFGLPKLFEKGKELTYEVEGPTLLLDKKGIGNASIAVNGVSTSTLLSYKVRIWNSGDQPLKNLPVLVLFDTNQSEFQVFSVRHETSPAFEFGTIKEDSINGKSKRFIFDLLNPKDQDTIWFLTNNSASLKVYAKAEGLKVNWEKPEKFSGMWSIISVALAVVSSLLSVILKDIGDYFNKLKFLFRKNLVKNSRETL